MNQREEHLDALIDRLLTGDSSELITDDRDLGDLLQLAREVRGTREPDWPDAQFPKTLAAQVTRRLEESPETEAINDNGPAKVTELESRPSAHTPDESDRPTWRRRVRQIGEMVAAAIVLVLITGALILAYQNLLGDEEATPGTDEQTITPGEGIPSLSDGGTIDEFDMVLGAGIGTVNGQEYAFLLTAELPEQDDTDSDTSFMLHVMLLDPEGDHERIGSTDVPLDVAFVPDMTPFEVVDGVLYASVQTQDEPGIWTVDVSEPAAPEHLAFVADPGPPFGLSVSENLIVTAGLGGRSLSFLDISESATPEAVGQYDFDTEADVPNMVIISSLVYVVDPRGLSIIDVSDPANPSRLGLVENEDLELPPRHDPLPADLRRIESRQDALHSAVRADAYLDVAVDGERAYVATGGQRLLVIDVSDPTNPVEVETIDRQHQPLRLELVGNYLYLYEIDAYEAEEPDEFMLNYSIRVLDVSDPAEPAEITQHERMAADLDPESLGPVPTHFQLGDTYLMTYAPQGVRITAIDWLEDEGEASPDVTPEATNINIDDPQQFAVAMINAVNEQDWDTLRGMLVEPYSGYGDLAVATLTSHSRTRAQRVGGATESENWDVEEYDNWVTVRHREDPAFSITLVENDGQAKLRPGPFLSYFSQISQDTGVVDHSPEQIENLYPDVIDVRMSSSTGTGVSLGGMFEARPATIPDDGSDPLVGFQVTANRQEHISLNISDVTWSAGEESGPAELVWTDARLENNEAHAIIPIEAPGDYWFEFRLSGMDHTVDSVTVTFEEIEVITATGAVMPGGSEEVSFSARYEFVHSRDYDIVPQTDDGATMPGEYISALDFPHIEGANSVESIQLDPGTLESDEYVIRDASAALLETDARLEDLNMYYSHPAGPLSDDGWELFGSGHHGRNIAFTVLRQHDPVSLLDDIMVLTFVHSRDVSQAPTDTPFMPFDLEGAGMAADTGFIQAIRLACDDRGEEFGCRAIAWHIQELLEDD